MENMAQNKLTIAFFGSDFSRQGKGTALVIQRLAENLLSHHGSEVEIVLLRPDGPVKSDVIGRVKNVIIPRKLSTALSFFWFFLSHRERYDAVIFNRNVYPGFWFLRAKKKILFMYDASESEAFRVKTTFANFAFEKFLSFIGQYFLDAVIAISYDARDWIVKRHHIKAEKVKTIYGAAGEDFKPINDDEWTASAKDLKGRYGIQTPYILDVARLDPHKNVDRLVDAFFLLKGTGLQQTLVLAGGKHDPQYTQLVEDKIAASEYCDSVKFVDYIQLEDMSRIYSLADLFVFPSLMEGFGMPVIEAMQCGTPVVTSNISSLPEVSGGAALLVDPLSVTAIAEGMEKVLGDEALRKELIQKGLARAKDFSWERSAGVLLKVVKA
jgi:glycosyltransferase involved in cell wall biosynthesis